VKRVNYFELDLPLCGNTHGVSPCTATETGNAKCYNSRATCNDLANFRLSTPDVYSITQTTFHTNTTAHNVKMPRTVGAGDLLIALFANDGSATVTTPAGWTSLATGVSGTLMRGSIYAKVADGTEDTALANVGTINLASGTAFGDFTNNGGLAAAFDGGTSENTAASATSVGGVTSGYVGTSITAGPKSIFSCTVYGSNDNGFVSGANPTVTLNLRGKNDSQPSSQTDGTIVGTVSFTDTANESAGRAITMSDQTTQYDYFVVQITHNGAAASTQIAEVTLTESAPAVDFVTSATEAAAAQVYQVLKNRWKGAFALDAVGVAVETAVTQTDSPTPPSITPPWGEATTLFIAGAMSDNSEDIVGSYPSGFSDGVQTRGGHSDTGVSVASSATVAKVDSIDPGDLEFDEQSPGMVPTSVAYTIAIQPLSEASLRFCTAAMYNDKSIEALPDVIDMDHTPQVMSLGETLGERGSVKVKFEDHPHPDTGDGYDPYLADRTYNPYTQGTHWGKFRARHAFIQGSACRMIRGFEGESIDSMDTKHFILDGMAGPSTDWDFTISAKDVLKLLDGDKAQAPAVCTATASEALDASELGIDMSPTGIGDTDFGTSGYVCVGGKEVCSYTRSEGSDTLTVVRGQLGTTGTTHDSGVRLQRVLAFEGEDVATILQTLLVDYGGIPGNLIPISSWQSEVTAFINRLYTAYITEPTSVKKLCNELIEQAGLEIWQSDDPHQINLQVLRAVAGDTIDENVIMEDSLQIEELTDKRLSQVWTFYAPRDKTRPLDEESNYASVLVTVDEDAAADYATPGIKKIFSRWIPAGGQTAAERINDLLLAQYRRAPRRFKFDIFADNEVDPAIGNGYLISTPQIQDQNGAQTSVPVIITSIKSEPDKLSIVADELQLGGALSLDLDGDVLVLNSDQNDVDLLTMHEQLYDSAESGDNVYVFISSGVVIGASSRAAPALTIEGFATGVNIYLIVEGRIQGAGGNAGDGGDAGASAGDGGDGQNGGTALYARFPVNIDASFGELWGGGGGGGGGGGANGGSGTRSGGGGGGGGSGTEPGNGNSGGNGITGGGDGDDGNAGSSEAGGNGGNGATGGADGGDGGDGGGPGQGGNSGSNGASGGGSGGSGGDAGNATDGNSYLTYGSWDDDAETFTAGVVGSEDIRGGEVN
jgi:hypothetical protein